MIRLDFGDKTFRIETDNSDDLLIHTVHGRHPGDHYTGEVFNTYYQKIAKEIPFGLNNTTNRWEQDNIYIILLGGVEIVNDGLGSPWGGTWGSQVSSVSPSFFLLSFTDPRTNSVSNCAFPPPQSDKFTTTA